MLTLSIGSKERPGFPLTKNTALSSGMMVEGPNTQPIPQIRGEIKEFLNVPGTKGWLAFKGHIAYGSFTDNGWQRICTTGAVFHKGCTLSQQIAHAAVREQGKTAIGI